LEKAREFVPLDMLKAIPNPEKTTIEADIKLQLQEALVLTIAAIDPSLDDSFCATEVEVEVEAKAIEDCDPLARQANYIPLNASDMMDWNYLNADDDADTRLF
jgi:hypothetical protein